MDTWGAELHPALDVPQGTAIVRKGSNGEDGYSAFTMRDPSSGKDVPTMLQPLLQAAGVEEVVIVGFATDYCVRATVARRDPPRTSGPRCSPMRSRPSTSAEGDGERALAELEAAGAVLHTSRMR